MKQSQNPASSATHSYSEMFVRHPSKHHLKTGVGVQFSGDPNHAVSQDEKSSQQESAWGLGLRHSRLRPRYCGEPVGGAADRAAPASRSSLQASQTPGPPERELWGHKAMCSSASHTLRAPIPPPLGERNRDVSELFWAGQESWNTAVRSRRARTQRLRLQEDPRREFKAHLNARALLPLPALEVSTARCSRNRTESHPIQNPNSNFEPHSRQADSGPASSRSPSNRYSNPWSGHPGRLRGKGIFRNRFL